MENLGISTMQQTTWWQDTLTWAKDNTIVFGSIALGWRAIDKGFKYLSEGRKEEILALIHEEFKTNIGPQINRLSENMEGLKEAIWELKKNFDK